VDKRSHVKAGVRGDTLLRREDKPENTRLALAVPLYHERTNLAGHSLTAGSGLTVDPLL
jgi:hypothetical protein